MHNAGGGHPHPPARPSAHPPMDLARLKTYPIARRKNLVSVRDFAAPVEPGRELERFLKSFPHILAVREFRALASAIALAHRHRKEVVVAMGAHVLKTGCSPLLVDLIERGIVTAVALNGGGAIHDYELSLIGETSEDVAESLEDGSFGMAEETAKAMALAFKEGARTGQGLGHWLGHLIHAEKNPHEKISVLAAAHHKGIPATVHVAVGTDIVHMHPGTSGMALGESSLIDFRILCGVVSRLEGGVWINLGSAVLMPEVFVKALTVARNLGHAVRHFTAANLDMHQHYRPRVNVLARPRGKAIALTGHHELLLPLLRAAVLCELHAEGNTKS
jgi:deoxyhypusine synthase